MQQEFGDILGYGFILYDFISISNIFQEMFNTVFLIIFFSLEKALFI